MAALGEGPAHPHPQGGCEGDQVAAHGVCTAGADLAGPAPLRLGPAGQRGLLRERTGKPNLVDPGKKALPPARILHATQAVPFETEVVTNFYHGDLTRFDSGIAAAAELYGRTGLTPDDIDVAMLYDHFSIAVWWHLEALGFCKPGEAPDFVKDGHLALDGKLPLSPNGGLLGEAYIHGMNNITEAVRQIRGTAANQIASVENVIVSSGMSAAILSRC